MCSKKALQNLKTLLKREKTIVWHASIGKSGSQMKMKNGLTMPATQLMKELFSTCWKMSDYEHGLAQLRAQQKILVEKLK